MRCNADNGRRAQHRQCRTRQGDVRRFAVPRPHGGDAGVSLDGAILGDVNPEYALKYMTSFLLKFLKKEEVQQKRKDIFVDSLEVLGYIHKNDEGKYELAVDLDKERLMFIKQ